MNENEERAFKRIYQFYEKWRSQVIETEEQWAALPEEVGQIGAESDGCPLLFNLMTAALDTLNTLYQNGMKPMPANYFGRDDL